MSLFPSRSKSPIPITVYKLKDKIYVDPLSSEQKGYDVRLTVTTMEDGTLCDMQKGGEAPIKQEEIEEMVKIAAKKSEELRKKL